MDEFSTIRRPLPTGTHGKHASARLGIMLVASPVTAALWKPLVVSGSLIVARVAEAGVMDDEMSRRHATVRRDRDMLIVSDGTVREDGSHKPSANGTLGPDGQPLGGRSVALRRGDTFQTGQSLWVVLEEPTARVDPDTLLRGVSPAMVRLREDIAVIVAMVASRFQAGARIQQAMMIRGPRGSGKQVVAQEAHRLLKIQLNEPNAPFRQVAAPSLADGTVAADLFGVVAGYATGTKARPGYFEQAHGGILLLDEVGDTPASAQARLLNALQEREVTPLGAKRSIPFDCLVIGATNRALSRGDDDEESAHRAATGEGRGGSLRADLIDRLARFEVTLPPLRERPEDIPMITETLLRRHGMNRPLAAPLMRTLMTRWWPGNVRELDSVLERLVALSAYRGEAPSAALLDRCLSAEADPKSPPPPVATTPYAAPEPAPEPPQSQGPPSRDELVRALEAAGWNKSEVARRYGRTARQVRRWIASHDIPMPVDD